MEYLDNEKNILGEITSIFHHLLRAFLTKYNFKNCGLGFFFIYVDFTRGIIHSIFPVVVQSCSVKKAVLRNLLKFT